MSWRFWWENPAILRAVIVNLKGEDKYALRGVLWASRGRWVTLKDVYHLHAEHGREPVKLDGEVVLERSAISFIQVL